MERAGGPLFLYRQKTLHSQYNTPSRLTFYNQATVKAFKFTWDRALMKDSSRKTMGGFELKMTL